MLDARQNKDGLLRTVTSRQGMGSFVSKAPQPRYLLRFNSDRYNSSVYHAAPEADRGTLLT